MRSVPVAVASASVPAQASASAAGLPYKGTCKWWAQDKPAAVKAVFVCPLGNEAVACNLHSGSNSWLLSHSTYEGRARAKLLNKIVVISVLTENASASISSIWPESSALPRATGTVKESTAIAQ